MHVPYEVRFPVVCSAVKKQVQPQSGYHQEEDRESYRERLSGEDTRGQVCMVTVDKLPIKIILLLCTCLASGMAPIV